MQNAVPKNEGAMVAVLGTDINKVLELIHNNKTEFNVFLANDNSVGQAVISGRINEIEKFTNLLKKLKDLLIVFLVL